MKDIYLFILAIFISANLSGQISNGIYVGYEQNPFCYNDKCIIIHDTLKYETKIDWFQKVTMTVNGDEIVIKKIPIFFPKSIDSIPYQDSSAFNGCYFYKGQLSRFFSHRIDASLTNSKYSFRCGSAVCLYVYISYGFHGSGQNLYMDAVSEKNILFTKQ